MAIINNPIETNSWLSPAKLNLFLHILGRRSDGYHELQTVFQLIEFFDELIIEPTKTSKIHLDVTYEQPSNEKITLQDNLVFCAARLLQNVTSCSFGANIKLHKKIPMGGGLGGGSSNAATTLVALNYLWQLKLSSDQLCDLGKQLGADVPVFIKGKSAWAEGIGEKLQPIMLEEKWFVVIVPPCFVSTAKIFSHAQLTRDTSACKIHAFVAGTIATHNDCENVVRISYPIVAEALDWLNQYAPARLTGTGGCIFASFDQEKEAFNIMQKIPEPFYGFVAKGLNDSPLLKKVNR